MKYIIKQLKSIRDCDYAFRCYDCAKEHGISLDDYKVVYEGEIELDNPIEALEYLFYIFNVRHPEDFRGHSLSVSDIVELDGVNYYCDSCGWSKIK